MSPFCVSFFSYGFGLSFLDAIPHVLFITSALSCQLLCFLILLAHDCDGTDTCIHNPIFILYMTDVEYPQFPEMAPLYSQHEGYSPESLFMNPVPESSRFRFINFLILKNIKRNKWRLGYWLFPFYGRILGGSPFLLLQALKNYSLILGRIQIVLVESLNCRMWSYLRVFKSRY